MRYYLVVAIAGVSRQTFLLLEKRLYCTVALSPFDFIFHFNLRWWDAISYTARRAEFTTHSASNTRRSGAVVIEWLRTSSERNQQSLGIEDLTSS